MTLIDTHAHLYYDDMYNNLDNVLEDALNKEFKREGIIEFRTDSGYPGAGYAFDLVLDKIVKRLNR